jgi:hypothetical protein
MLWGVGVYVVGTIVGLVIIGYVLLKLPSSYVRHRGRQHFWGDKHPAAALRSRGPEELLGCFSAGGRGHSCIARSSWSWSADDIRCRPLARFSRETRILRWLLSRKLIVTTRVQQSPYISQVENEERLIVFQ